MSARDPVVVVGAARTPMGGLQGDFAAMSAPQLGAVAIAAAVERAGMDKAAVEEIVMGCVLPAGQGQAPARQASRGAGLPDAAAHDRQQDVRLGHEGRHVRTRHAARGDQQGHGRGRHGEHDQRALSPAGPRRLSDGTRPLIDSMFFDGLEDAYERGRLMGTFAEDAAQAYQVSREAQDAYALASLTGR